MADLTADAGFTAGRVDVLVIDDAVALLDGAGAAGGGGAVGIGMPCCPGCIGGGHPSHIIVLLL